MATLELAIDATKAQQGAQVAQQAFTQVQKAAEGAARSVQVSSQAVSAAFQATGGTVQVAGGITATAKALSELNVAAASSNAARLLLEIGKTAQDFRDVAAGIPSVTRPIIETIDVFDDLGVKVGETSRVIGTVTEKTTRFGTVFATLNGIIKANPLLAAATAISAIGTALTLFTSESKQAADAYRGFTEELAKTRISDEAAAILGIRGPGAQGRAGALQRAAEFTAAGGAFTTGQLPGYDREIAQFLQRQGTARQQAIAQEYLQTGGTLRTTMQPSPGLQGMVPVQERVPGLPGTIELTRQQTEALLKELYATNQKQLDAEKASAAAADDAAKARRQIADQLQAQLVQFGDLPTALGGQMVSNTQPNLGYRPPYFLEVPQYQFGAGPAVQERMPQVGFPTGGYATAGYQYSNGRLRPEYQVEPGQAPPLLARPDRITMTDTGGTATMASQAFENAVVTAAAIANYKKQEEEAARRVAENFQRAADYAGQVGGSLGSAFADVLMKTTTLRQAFASIVASFARQGLADIGSAIFRGAVSGLTPNQASANVGINQQTQA